MKISFTLRRQPETTHSSSRGLIFPADLYNWFLSNTFQYFPCSSLLSLRCQNVSKSTCVSWRMFRTRGQSTEGQAGTCPGSKIRSDHLFLCVPVCLLPLSMYSFVVYVFLLVVYVFLLWSMFSYCSSMYSYCWLCILIVVYVFLDAATLTEVFPCFFLRCKANARV